MPLASDIATQIATYLTKTVGTIGPGAQITPTGATIFVNEMPGEPDDVISIFAYGGNPPSVDMEVEYPNFQVRVRAHDHDDAFDTAYSILGGLHMTCRTTLSGTLYYWIAAKQSPSSLGRDQKGRHIYVVNFDVTKEME